ncbi:MAG: hypothetical protein FJW90_12225 [Actinobacteria bacterium]|nr:hypothetical protein [Actinomycetota bacterium]
MSSRSSKLRLFFAHQEDPYAGGDLANAQRLGALLWVLVVVLIVVLWIPSPPNEAIGDAGWAPAIALTLIGAGLIWAMRTGRIITSWGSTLAMSYGAVVAICVLQWLAGGGGSPYERVFLLPILYVAVLHPPRRIAAFMGLWRLRWRCPSSMTAGTPTPPGRPSPPS